MGLKSYPFRGKADVYIAKRLATEALTLAALRAVGNVLDAKVTTKETEDKVPDMRLGASGSYASYSDIESAGLDLTFIDYSPENLSLALLADTDGVAGGTVTDEIITFRHGIIVSPHVGISDVVITNAYGTTTYVEGVDYAVTGAGIIGLEGSAIAVGTELKRDYAYPNQTNVEIATVAANEYFVLVDGANYAMGGLVQVGRFYRAKFGAGSGVDLISEKLARLPLKAELLPDNSKVGAGISKYARLQNVSPV